MLHLRAHRRLGPVLGPLHFVDLILVTEFPPQPLSDPYVTLSRHTAPIIQPYSQLHASGETTAVRLILVSHARRSKALSESHSDSYRTAGIRPSNSEVPSPKGVTPIAHALSCLS